ncbi:uncharacterized protein ACA1_077900 [Acanthamoeba castellanii str. Neff]|uniref:Uncharacterized protein n=1 Tax=Acanthamoeba castellanii (strain ATCC 30010 / Neff) TaxID=1257118 RepID=L8GNR6_ACACF|nr:uncharacterized protein ACA1_077900 [Acanthamoeba castellanii str. Neff]ELR14559.1 hypothetical protein ACA1_077900 [Acanthamoeba castellanii str. Neff]
MANPRNPAFLLVAFLCFLATSAFVSGATLEVCQSGACAYSSVTAALLAARGGDVVHVQKGNYANEATTNVIVSSDITLRHALRTHLSFLHSFVDVTNIVDLNLDVSLADNSGDQGAVISLSFAYPTNQWLSINGTLTLVGDLTLVVNAGNWPNNAILVPAGGQLVQKGNLNFVGGNARYGGSGITVQGVYKQTGNLTAATTGTTAFGAIVQLQDQGTWLQDTEASVDMQLLRSTGVSFSNGGSWLQKGEINMKLDQSANGVACLVKPNKVWVQQGRVNMITSNFSVGISLNTGKWQGFGDIDMIVLDSGSEGISCYNPTVDVAGRVLVQQNGACYTLLVPTRCTLKPRFCP